MLEPVSKIKANLGFGVNGEIQKYFTNECARKMDKYIPYDNKILRQSRVVGDDYIDYRTPYAHYQYVGELYVDPKTGKGAFYTEERGFLSRKDVTKVPSGRPLNYHTLGTGNYWDKRMWSAEGKEIIKDVEKHMKGK